MSSLNKALILGRLGQDPELRYTANQTPVVSLNLATSEYRPATANGEKQEHTEWHRVIVWERSHRVRLVGSMLFETQHF